MGNTLNWLGVLRLPLTSSAAACFPKSAVRAGRWIGLPALSRLAARIADGYRKRRAINDLLALDDCTLKDIGVPRCKIPYRVHRGRLN